MILEGKKAVISGGNAGIGRAITLAYAKEGADVAIYGRNEEKNAAVAAEAEALGVKALSDPLRRIKAGRGSVGGKTLRGAAWQNRHSCECRGDISEKARGVQNTLL